MMTEAEKIALVRRIYERIWNKGDFTVVSEIYAPDYVQHNPLPGQSEAGRDAMQRSVQELRISFPDLRVEIGELVLKGDEVTTMLTLRGHHQAPWIGIAPTGKLVAVAAVVIHKIADGKVSETWASNDEEGLMQQLGRAIGS